MEKEVVILLHGLARTSASMGKLAKALTQAGYEVINIDYPSRSFSIEQLAQQAMVKALRQAGNKKVNVVTHSMGGILIRYYLQNINLQHKFMENLSRVVMLGPPNQGSEIVDKLKNLSLFKLLNGKAGIALGTDHNSVPKQLTPVNFDLGVIAGTKSFNPLLSLLLPEGNDGKVSIASTKVLGMNDHICLPVTHTFMMQNPRVIKQVVHYLKQGCFQH